LKRYLAEFDYRYNERVSLGVSDSERMRKSVQGIVGKRLTFGGLITCRTSKPKLTRAQFFAVLAAIRRSLE
jgi:hypothetical protein